MIVAGYILIAASVIGFVFQPLFSAHKQLVYTPGREKRQNKLLEEREMLFEALRELDFDYKMGKVEKTDYLQTRPRYAARAIDLMKAIEKESSQFGEVEDRIEKVEDRIEKEIIAIRNISKRKSSSQSVACTNCKVIVPSNARFCPQCGISISQE